MSSRVSRSRKMIDVIPAAEQAAAEDNLRQPRAQ
jgi:hypothetical protein